jgi:sulfide:quinone oxidoreductase
MRRAPRSHVVIAGGGVAALETLLALRAVAGDRVEITVVAPNAKFVNRSMAVEQPANVHVVGGLRLRDVTSEHDARWHRGTVDRVDRARQVVVSEHGEELAYGQLVLALGAHPEREWHCDGVLTYHDAAEAHEYRCLLRQLEEGRVRRVAFVKPAGASWLLPLYELVLTAAAVCEASGVAAELSLFTPEANPLEVFGDAASEEIRTTLRAAGVHLHTSCRATPSRPGRLHVSPGDYRVQVDRVVTLPRLVGPALNGVPPSHDGFICTDAHGRAVGLRNVFAAGDAASFPIKQGGLAAQQADAVAEAIAAAVGADVVPQPFRPVLRGLLTAGGNARYMRARIATGIGDDSSLSEQPLWWPPNRLCGRYLAPYLSSRAGGAAVMYQDEATSRAAAAQGLAAVAVTPISKELADL